MSSVAPGDRDKWWAAKGRCFYCGQEIPQDKTMVMWDGSTAVIALHWACASKLGAHLIGDARQAQISNGETVWQRQKTMAVEMLSDHLQRQEFDLPASDEPIDD